MARIEVVWDGKPSLGRDEVVEVVYRTGLIIKASSYEANPGLPKSLKIVHICFKAIKSCFCALCLQVTNVGGVEEVESVPTVEWLLERTCYHLLQQFRIFSKFRWDERKRSQLFAVRSCWNRNRSADTWVLPPVATFVGSDRGNGVLHRGVLG